MTPIQVLQNHFVDKTIAPGGDYLPLSLVGSKIISVALHPYEPIFEFAVVRDGHVEIVDVLDDWDVPVNG